MKPYLGLDCSTAIHLEGCRVEIYADTPEKCRDIRDAIREAIKLADKPNTHEPAGG